MTSDIKYKYISPYTGDEVKEAAARLCNSQGFLSIFSDLCKIDVSVFVKMLSNVTTLDEYQEYFFGPVIQAIMNNSTDGVEIIGLDKLDKSKSYLFISNHRDIILDSAMLNLLLRNNGFKYCSAAIGNNLFVNEWVVDLVKLNSCFTVERNVSVRGMLQSSALRSEYIRDVIKECNKSVWIAQREGRTKNGDDATQQALLKMFKMSGDKDFFTNFKELNIVPVSISYEIEPCDDMKANELFIKSISEFAKTPEHDMMSMVSGLKNKKGKVYFTVNKIEDEELQHAAQEPNNGDRIAALARLIDDKIHKSYFLHKNNYIAYDILNSTDKYSGYYSSEDYDKFMSMKEAKLSKSGYYNEAINKIYLEIYSNPVRNKLEL